MNPDIVKTETTLNITDGKKSAGKREDMAEDIGTKTEVIRTTRKMAIIADNGIINPQGFKTLKV